MTERALVTAVQSSGGTDPPDLPETGKMSCPGSISIVFYNTMKGGRLEQGFVRLSLEGVSMPSSQGIPYWSEKR